MEQKFTSGRHILRSDHDAAVYEDGFAGGEGAGVRGEVDKGAAEVLGPSPALHGNVAANLVGECVIGVDYPAADDGIDANIVSGPLEAEGAGEVDDPGLCRRKGGSG